MGFSHGIPHTTPGVNATSGIKRIYRGGLHGQWRIRILGGDGVTADTAEKAEKRGATQIKLIGMSTNIMEPYGIP